MSSRPAARYLAGNGRPGTFLVLALLLLLAVPSAAASSISPAPKPTSVSTACPTVPLLPGSTGANASLIAFLQPGATAGTTCALPEGGTLVGNEVILTLYTPEAVPNGVVAISVKEYVPGTETVSAPGPNNTTIVRVVPVETDVVWSNTSISAAPLEVQQDLLTVPIVPSSERLTVGILGVALDVAIVTPGGGTAIPQNYPELLLHDFGFEIAVTFFLIVGIGAATAVRLKARHIERIWPFGVLGIGSGFVFAEWFYSDYPLSAIPLGTAPEAVVAVPVVLVGMYLWLALFPTEAKLWKIQYPVADLKDGSRSYDEERFRVFESPRGAEYIGTGGNGALLRLLGVPTLLDDRVLTDTPHKILFHGFRSVRFDTYGLYHAWAPTTGKRVLEVHRSKVVFLPWRRKAYERITEYHKQELLGRVAPPSLVNWIVHVTPSRAFLRANGKQGAILAAGWIEGTLTTARVGDALERILRAYSHLLANVKAHAIEWGNKIALTLRFAEEIPGSPIAMKAMEDLTTRQEAEIMSERTWYDYLSAQVAEEGARKPPRTTPEAPEAIMREAANPSPPDSPRRKVPPGALGDTP